MLARVLRCRARICSSNGWPHAVLLAAWFVPSLVFLIALDFSAVQLEDDLVRLTSRRRLGHTVEAATRSSIALRWLSRIRLGTTGGVIMCLVPVLVAIGAIDLVDACLPSLCRR